MIRGLICLAFGALSFGIAEFVVMGLLPYLSQDLAVSIDTAGHSISAYALGVVIGAFFMIFLKLLRLKHILLLILSLHCAGIAFTCFSESFYWLLAGRLLSGFPHGCFFGVGAIVAQRLATRGHGNSAMAVMVAGQTLANVFGVPLGTALADLFSWRAIFWLLLIWSTFVLLCTCLLLPDTGKLQDKGFASQFAFLRRKEPWLVIGMIFCGSGGLFCVQTYVSPLLTDLGDLELGHVPAVLMAAGICMLLSNLVSGHLADKFSSSIVTAGYFILGSTALLLLATLGHFSVIAVVCICMIAAVMFGVATPEQVMMVRSSAGGELLGVAMGQVGFNLGNALGALAGGLPFAFALNVRAVPLIGLLFLLPACLCVYYFRNINKTS